MAYIGGVRGVRGVAYTAHSSCNSIAIVLTMHVGGSKKI